MEICNSLTTCGLKEEALNVAVANIFKQETFKFSNFYLQKYFKQSENKLVETIRKNLNSIKRKVVSM